MSTEINPFQPPAANLEGAGTDDNTSGLGRGHPIPDGVKGWSWGAFFLNWIWSIGNKTWIGLLALIPYVGLIVAVVLAIKGREWAWQNKRWDDLDHFNRVQRRWSAWGVGVFLVPIIGMLVAVVIPMFAKH